MCERLNVYVCVRGSVCVYVCERESGIEIVEAMKIEKMEKMMRRMEIDMSSGREMFIFLSHSACMRQQILSIVPNYSSIISITKGSMITFNSTCHKNKISL